MRWCDKDESHAGPFYTVFAVAMEAGPGSRIKNRKRIQARRTVARLCAKCLHSAEFRLLGANFFTVDSRDPAKD